MPGYGARFRIKGDRSMPDTPAPPAKAADPSDDIPHHPRRAELERMRADPRISADLRQPIERALSDLTKLEILQEAIRIKRRRGEG